MGLAARAAALASLILLASHLAVLHRLDGAEVTVNADLITSLRSPEGVRDSVPHGHCIIGLSDGKFVTVLETCQKVRQQIERDQ